jgi:uncharacterized protein YbaP (TraB family)
MFKNYLRSVVAAALVFLYNPVFCQKNAPGKYPSLFWEITGNGLTRPSYLFGTMHVSNKMVFYLSDSFYYAMKNVDAVALELNPDIWQGQMVRLDKVKQNYADFIRTTGDDLLTENSFRIDNYDDQLKAALSTEPTVVNNLLYRSYKAREDFEEDTFLDLYIFQTGKKLGKRSAGVEDFYETEKIVLQAYADMATEKKKKTIDTDGESMRDITKKIQEAYRRGDLDLMDSLDIMTERSIAFREKFLYLRNEVQAGSIDTILKRSSLFVGVGAAHLPGTRGVIELLRKKGYRLRPIKMTDRDAAKKDETDKLKVPVVFSKRQADDGFYSVDMPGPLFKITGDYQGFDRRQYADMSNGSYYLVTRIKTYAAFARQTEEQVMKKVDSMLYENIPGKILKKIRIEKDGYMGFDITNKTRTGDLQRYNIFITPFEVLFFKMSGKENYAEGTEADRFFSSIHLKEREYTAVNFSPAQGGFSINMIQLPTQNLNLTTSDGIDRWEYQAADKITGNAYLIFKKSVYNFKFLEADTFNLRLIEESFRTPDLFDKQLQRKLSSFDGYPCLDVKEKMKDGGIVAARYIIKGPAYYVIAASSKNAKTDFSGYFNSFRFAPYRYGSNKFYTDSFLHFTVTSPVVPDLDAGYRAKLEQVSKEVAESKIFSAYNSYWPKVRNAQFKNDSTGEVIGVSIQQYPQYYYVKDTAKFWSSELEDYIEKNELLLYNKDSFILSSGVRGFRFELRDTASSVTISRLSLLKDNYMYNIVTTGDTLNSRSAFIDAYFKSFVPEQKKTGRNIFINCLDSFFADLFSKDSTVHLKAKQALSDVYFGEKGVSVIMNALQKITPADKDYYTIKAKLIAELGYIKDTSKRVVVNYLKKIYEQTADTSLFQNEVITALAKHKSSDAIKLFKTLVLQDPPIFDKEYNYAALFSNLEDSLSLAAALFPELLQLTTLQDYREPVISLLVKLADSGLVKGLQYQDYLSKIYFDAKTALKKQQGKEENKMYQNRAKDDAEDEEVTLAKSYSNSSGNSELDNYTVLLMPFYDSNANVRKYMDKLLKSQDENIRMNTAIFLLKSNKQVPDSILTALAAKDFTRGTLFTKMEKIKRLDKFPAEHKTQIDLARSYLLAEKNYASVDSVVFVAKKAITFNERKGMVYFFKYRIKKEDDWKIGISGLQPENIKQVSSNDKLCFMTDKKIREDMPLNEQLEEQLKRLLFTFHKSAKNFFEQGGNNFRYRRGSGYED